MRGIIKKIETSVVVVSMIIVCSPLLFFALAVGPGFLSTISDILGVASFLVLLALFVWGVIKITKIVKEKDESIAQRLKKWQVLFSVTLAVFVSLFGFLFLFVTFGDKNDPDNKLFDSFVFYWALFSITAIFISLFMMIFYKNNNKDQLVFNSDNKSGQIAIQRFSWGAFGLGFLWGVYFKVYWLSLVWIAPLVLLFIFPRAWNFFLIAQCVNCFILGRKGAAIAYSRNKKLPAEKLLKSFRIWDNLAIIPSIVLLFIFFASILSILMQ